MTNSPEDFSEETVSASAKTASGKLHAGTRRGPSRTTINIDQIHNNTSQEVIHITSDKLRLALIGHLDCLSKKNAWHVPLSLFASVVVVFFTSTFKDAFGIKADKLEFAFSVFAVVVFVWLIFSLLGLRKSATIEDLIQIIKNK